jgi:hypothetical protein
MHQRQDLLAFLDLATELLDLQLRVLQAYNVDHVVTIAREYGFFFEAHELRSAAGSLFSDHWSWLSRARLWHFDRPHP